MRTIARSSTEQKLLEYVQLRSVGPPEVASIFELTSTVEYAIEANDSADDKLTPASAATDHRANRLVIGDSSGR